MLTKVASPNCQYSNRALCKARPPAGILLAKTRRIGAAIQAAKAAGTSSAEPRLGVLHWVMPFVLPGAAFAATAACTGAFAAGAEPWVKWLVAGSGPLLMHLLLPALDFLVGERRPEPIPPSAKAPAPDSLPARLVPVLAVVAHISVLAASYAALASVTTHQPVLLALAALSLGVSATGTMAAAHELVHSRNPVHLAAVTAFLVLHWWYPYYRVHHQHHLHVGTPVDYTCAPKGVHAYSFIPRYIWCSYVEAWQLSAAECNKAGKSAFSLSNSALVGFAAQALLSAAIYAVFGPTAALVHAGATGVILLYMSVFDYVLHYGLTRPELPASGGGGGAAAAAAGTGRTRFAPVTVYNSWSSLYPVENAVLFNVLYHGDHHMVGGKSYGWLRPAASGPSYPAPINMLALSVFVPPLWSAIMDERADAANKLNLEYLGMASQS